MVKGLAIFALIFGITAGLIGSQLGDDPNDPDVQRERALEQVQANDEAMDRGEPLPVLTWSRPWPAEHPFLFGLLVGGTVFVVGLLVIIAQNSTRRE